MLTVTGDKGRRLQEGNQVFDFAISEPIRLSTRHMELGPQWDLFLVRVGGGLLPLIQCGVGIAEVTLQTLSE